MSRTASDVIATRALTRVHGSGPTRVEALRGIDLTVAPGEFVAVTGVSGSGKSTLLHLLAGLDRPTSGTIHVGGVNFDLLDDEDLALLRRQRLGLIFQSFHLLEVLNVEENVALPLAIGGSPPAVARRRALETLARVGLFGRRHHRPCELSGGERQRAAIARALVSEPLILLADEPTGSLDSATGGQILALLRQLVDEHHTLLLVTHNPEHAAQADRQLILCDGRITTVLTLSDIPPRPRSGGEGLGVRGKATPP